jgi:hypothetical protein
VGAARLAVATRLIELPGDPVAILTQDRGVWVWTYRGAPYVHRAGVAEGTTARVLWPFSEADARSAHPTWADAPDRRSERAGDDSPYGGDRPRHRHRPGDGVAGKTGYLPEHRLDELRAAGPAGRIRLRATLEVAAKRTAR